MIPRQCEWCLSAGLGADGRISHLPVCPLYPLKVLEFSEIPDEHYCPKCREKYKGSPADHHNDKCVYENGCPTCKRKYIDKYHIERCKNAEIWKSAELPPLTPKSELILIPELEKEPQGSHLISNRKPVTASSVESYYYRPEIVTGRAGGTRWSSQHSDSQWITIDLEDIHTVDGVTLDWESAHAKEFEILTSINQVVWTIVYSTFFGRGRLEQIQFRPIEARYVKMLGKRRATQWGYSLYAFRVYGKESGFDLPMKERIIRKWGSRPLPYNNITIVDERKVPWLHTSAQTVTGS